MIKVPKIENTFGSRLRSMRIQKELRVEHLGILTGLSTDDIINLEMDIKKPTFRIFKFLETALGSKFK